MLRFHKHLCVAGVDQRAPGDIVWICCSVRLFGEEKAEPWGLGTKSSTRFLLSRELGDTDE